MASGIYIITCDITGRVYVGSSNNIQRRFWEHKSTLRNSNHANEYLQNAWNKHGEDNFTFEVLQYCSENSRYKIEHFWCIVLSCHNRKYGFNLLPTDPYQQFQDKTTIEKRTIKRNETIRNRGYLHNEESRNKIRMSNKGKKLSDIQKDKISKSLSGRLAHNKGIKLTENHIKKIQSIKLENYNKRGYYFKEETNIKRKEANMWRYKKPFYVKNLETNEEFIIDYLFQVEGRFGLDKKAIWAALNRKNGNCGIFNFKYIN